MKKYFTFRNVLLLLLGVFLVLQFFQIDKTNPSYDTAQDFMNISQPPADIAEMLKVTCYDCHSYETKYPWYTNIVPISWWIKNHIDHGRKHLNFSEWASYPADKAAHKLEECYEEVEEAHMPLASYTWMHGSAKLSDEQREGLARWFEAKYLESKSN